MGPTGDLIFPQKDDQTQKRKYDEDAASEADKSARKFGWGAMGVLLVSAVVMVKNLFFSTDAMALADDDGARSARRRDQADDAQAPGDGSGDGIDGSAPAGSGEAADAQATSADDWLADLPRRGGGSSVIFSTGPTSFSIPTTSAQFGFSAIKVTPVNDNGLGGPFDFARSLDHMPNLLAAISLPAASANAGGRGSAEVGVVRTGDTFQFSTFNRGQTGSGDGPGGTPPGLLQPGDIVSPPPGTGGDTGTPGTGGETPQANRAPRVDGPVQLHSTFVNQLLVIAAADLLINASDPDGDPIAAQQLSVSSGQIIANADGSWQFTPDPDFVGEVIFSYQISDGQALVVQNALLKIEAIPGKEIVGTDDADILIGTGGNDTITALAGNDIIDARGGDDLVHGGDGDDRIFAGDGNDIIYAGAGDDAVFGGAGDDTIFGEDGNDTIFAGAGNDIVFGGAGNDLIWGEDGNDILDGGEGNDTVYGGAGNDLLIGGEGEDLLHGDEGDDVIFGGAGEDIAYGGAGDDTFMATVDDGNDVYFGGAGSDTYDLSRTSADAEVDLTRGTAASAEIGEDSLNEIENVVGGSGNDVIIANDSVNEMWGGAGEDVFVFQTAASAGRGRGGRDKIMDMEIGDRIDLKDISREFADLVEDDLEDIGIKKFSILDEGSEFSKPGELKFKYDVLEDGSEVTVVEGNIDYDAEAEFEIEINGHIKLSWMDFDGVQGS